MCLCLSVDVFWPVASLFISKQLPQEDQALGSGLLQTANQVGRSLGLAIATGVQTSVDGSTDTQAGDKDFLLGLRAAQWFNVGLVRVIFIMTYSTCWSTTSCLLFDLLTRSGYHLIFTAPKSPLLLRQEFYTHYHSFVSTTNTNLYNRRSLLCSSR